MPRDCKDFVELIKTWPHEPWTAWSASDETEARYRAAKLDKFDMNMKKTFADVAQTETAQESLTSTSEAQRSDAACLGDKDPIKVENPTFIEMNRELKIVASAEGTLSKIHRDLKKAHAELVEAKDSRCQDPI
jgi:hypothetical protein